MATAFFVPLGPCTEPTGLAVTDPLVSPSLDWIGQPFASNYLIRYREVGDPVWMQVTTPQTTWNFDTLPGCGNYEMQIQSVCPQGSSAFVDFAFNTPDQLLGFGLADAVICNSDVAVLDATFSGATYQWDNGSNAPTRSVTGPGKYWVTVKLGGCTSTDTAFVSQINATATIQPVLCPGETFTVGSETFDAQHPGGQVSLGNIATGACDSIVNVSLQFLTPSQNLLMVNSCDPSSSGVDPLFLTNAVGCDSLVITATSFDPAAISITSFFVKNCDPANVGVDTVFLTNAVGCDSLVVTTTTLAPISQAFLSATSCNPALVGVGTRARLGDLQQGHRAIFLPALPGGAGPARHQIRSAAHRAQRQCRPAVTRARDA